MLLSETAEASPEYTSDLAMHCSFLKLFSRPSLQYDRHPFTFIDRVIGALTVVIKVCDAWLILIDRHMDLL